MEGMSFETPKGKMTFRKEDHQAMQDMYHFKIKERPGLRLGRARAGARDQPKRTFRSATSAERSAMPDPQQARRSRSYFLEPAGLVAMLETQTSRSASAATWR
jgi:hypothetical protein